MRTVNVQEAKTHLSRLLRAVEAGEVVEIARAGTVIARITRAGDDGSVRLGGLAGHATWDDDAFDPLAGDELDAWDNAPVEPPGGEP